MIGRMVQAVALAALTATTVNAATVAEQPLAPDWNSGWCSPCAPQINNRVFASFSLVESTRLDTAHFAVVDALPWNVADLNVSVWNDPQGVALLDTTVTAAGYRKVGAGSRVQISIDLPDGWELAPGTYWLSLFGVNGGSASWGSDGSTGDDRVYNSTGTLLSSARHVGFSLEGETLAAVPDGSAALLFATGLGLLIPLRNKSRRRE
ncbi:MAG: hypothetical protein CALGDGBN_02841 [Pseudomonadales bacterium]|nr:hypothetical protein [Pseudomonadales bacterium]